MTNIEKSIEIHNIEITDNVIPNVNPIVNVDDVNNTNDNPNANSNPNANANSNENSNTDQPTQNTQKYSDTLPERIEDDKSLQLACPHCEGIFNVFDNEIRCRIFRHGVHKKLLLPMNPHASKEECDRLVEEGIIFGCGKPFEMIKDDNGSWKAVVCEYK